MKTVRGVKTVPMGPTALNDATDGKVRIPFSEHPRFSTKQGCSHLVLELNYVKLCEDAHADAHRWSDGHAGAGRGGGVGTGEGLFLCDVQCDVVSFVCHEQYHSLAWSDSKIRSGT